MQQNQGILLESGTNEFEIVEFRVGEGTYGINVAKVREVINLLPVTKLVTAHPLVEGIFTLRGRVIPLVNMAQCLGSPATAAASRIIVSELNNFYVGFKVDEVSRIHRISWEQMEPAPNMAGSSMVNGIVKMNDRLILLLDFEEIVSEINPDIKAKLTTVPTAAPDQMQFRSEKTILIAEDSVMLRDLLKRTLVNSGYTGLITTVNGQEAWNKLQEMLLRDEPLEKQLHLVITDIEMPKMDGHHLTKRIKEHDRLQTLPVIIFSSLINEEMRRKGEALGADAQITKPEIAQLIAIVDEKIKAAPAMQAG